MMMMPLPKKKVGAAALDESDGRRRASEAGRALVQRPRRDRGIAAKQCRSSQPLNRLGQIRGDGGLRHGAAAARPPRRRAPGARTNRLSAEDPRPLHVSQSVCVELFQGKKGFNPLFSAKKLLGKRVFRLG